MKLVAKQFTLHSNLEITRKKKTLQISKFLNFKKLMGIPNPTKMTKRMDESEGFLRAREIIYGKIKMTANFLSLSSISNRASCQHLKIEY